MDSVGLGVWARLRAVDTVILLSSFGTQKDQDAGQKGASGQPIPGEPEVDEETLCKPGDKAPGLSFCGDGSKNGHVWRKRGDCKEEEETESGDSARGIEKWGPLEPKGNGRTPPYHGMNEQEEGIRDLSFHSDQKRQRHRLYEE